MNNSVVASSERTGKGTRGYATCDRMHVFLWGHCVLGYRAQLD